MRVHYRPLPARQEYALARAGSASFRFGEAFYPSTLRVDRHAHKNDSVTLVLDGSLTETYAKDRAERCPPFTALFRPAGEPHTDVMGARGSLNLEIELIDARAVNLPDLRLLFEKPTRSQHPRLSALAQQIHMELRVCDTAQACVLEGLSLELLGVASRLTAGTTQRQAPPSWLGGIREVLHDSFMEPVRISDLAAIAEVHPVHLARVFRSWYGVTPGIYLRRLRLEWACTELTRAGGESLSRIAIAAGFSDQSHFTRTFKKHFGIPPGRLRHTRRQ